MTARSALKKAKHDKLSRHSKSESPACSSESESIGSDEDDPTEDDDDDDEEDGDDDDDVAGVSSQEEEDNEGEGAPSTSGTQVGDPAECVGDACIGCGDCESVTPVTSDKEDTVDNLESTDDEDDEDLAASDVCGDSDTDESVAPVVKPPAKDKTDVRKKSTKGSRVSDSNGRGSPVASEHSSSTSKKTKAGGDSVKRSRATEDGESGRKRVKSDSAALRKRADKPAAAFSFEALTTGCLHTVESSSDAMLSFFDLVKELRDGILTGETWGVVISVAVHEYVLARRPFYAELRSAYIDTQLPETGPVREKHIQALANISS